MNTYSKEQENNIAAPVEGVVKSFEKDNNSENIENVGGSTFPEVVVDIGEEERKEVNEKNIETVESKIVEPKQGFGYSRNAKNSGSIEDSGTWIEALENKLAA
jgi:hypothetical protein